MEQVNNVLPHYSDDEHEQYLQKLESDVLNDMDVQGKHNGLYNRPQTETEFLTSVVNKVSVQIQAGIDANARKHQPLSGVVMAKKIEDDARVKIHPINADQQEDEKKHKKIIDEIERLKPNWAKKIARRFIHSCLAIIAASDGWFSFQAFRFSSFPFFSALFAGCGVVTAVGFGAYYLAGYILKAPAKLQQRMRYVFVLFLYFTGFYIIGCYRSSQYNHVSALHINGHEASATSSAGISALSLATISTLMFWLALYLCLHFYRTEAEHKKEQEYKTKCRERLEIEQRLERRELQIANIQKEKEQAIGQAYARYEYALHCERWLVTLQKRAIALFIEKNLTYRSDGTCPSFFENSTVNSLSLFFDNIKTYRQ